MSWKLGIDSWRVWCNTNIRILNIFISGNINCWPFVAGWFGHCVNEYLLKQRGKKVVNCLKVGTHVSVVIKSTKEVGPTILSQ